MPAAPLLLVAFGAMRRSCMAIARYMLGVEFA